MSTLVMIHLNARLRPLDRGDHYEDPLLEALEQRAPGSDVVGGGTLLSGEGEPASADIELDLTGDVEAGVALVVDTLEAAGAPQGSTVRVGDADPVPFGASEGLGLYLNGTDLPAEVYATNDVNDLIAQLLDALGDAGGMQSWWHGPRELALYLYGPSSDRMRELIAPVLASHPLAERSRLVPLT
ncbi:MAG TPA: hypothetical protein VGD43_03480 [Micromonospora sp.]